MSQQNRPRQTQQVLTTVWAAGPQDIAINSHADAANSWVAVRVGQVLVYAIGLIAAQSIARIWTVAEDRAGSLLPSTTPWRPQTEGPSVSIRLTGEQTVRNDAYPYDGRVGSAHIVTGGVLWRPVDRAALTGIADAWRRAAQVALALSDD